MGSIWGDFIKNKELIALLAGIVALLTAVISGLALKQSTNNAKIKIKSRIAKIGKIIGIQNNNSQR